MNILFLGKKNHGSADQAVEFCRQRSANVESYFARPGESIPEGVRYWEGDLLISYLSRWIIPDYVLAHAAVAALNFHDGPPEYPGIGSINWALYEGASEYGVTCHHMRAEPDTGPIVAVTRFPVFPDDTVARLLQRTHIYQLVQFYSVVGGLFAGSPLPVANTRWGGIRHRRADLNSLSRLTVEMQPDEIAARMRATTYGLWMPTITLHGMEYEIRPVAAQPGQLQAPDATEERPEARGR